jgi:hypothetical protein
VAKVAFVHLLQRPATYLLILFLASFIVACRTSNRSQSETNPPPFEMFTDITEKSKLLFIHDPAVEGKYFFPEITGAGGAFLDYDNDGDLDVYLLNGARRNEEGSGMSKLRDRLFRQESNGTFVDVTKDSGLGDPGYGMGLAVGDIDNDGDVDVYVTNYGPDKLYRNEGDGTFSDISQQAGINNPGWGSSAVFFDYDRDDFLDLYVANYLDYDASVSCNDKSGRKDYCGPKAFPGFPDVLYHNNGDGTFSDVSKPSNIASVAMKGLGVVSADLNNDHYQDLYVANDGEPSLLWMNQRDGTFKDMAMILGAAVNALGQPEAGMGIAVGDVDADADFDLFVTHLRGETNTFYRNSGKLGFQDDTAASGLGAFSLPYTGFGTGFFDYVKDGVLGAAVGNGGVTRGTGLIQKTAVKLWDLY